MKNWLQTLLQKPFVFKLAMKYYKWKYKLISFAENVKDWHTQTILTHYYLEVNNEKVAIYATSGNTIYIKVLSGKSNYNECLNYLQTSFNKKFDSAKLLKY